MNIQFKQLTPEMHTEFLSYFENNAFPDNDMRSTCYCLESHVEDDSLYVTREERREKAVELIRSGVMTGYLIYDDDKIVGWCNTGDKTDFYPICANEELRTPDSEKGMIKILYCIDVAETHQGKGIANLIMEKVLSSAKEEGYSYVEGYPLIDRNYEWQYRGPARLYEKYGFDTYRETSQLYIMRKAL